MVLLIMLAGAGKASGSFSKIVRAALSIGIALFSAGCLLDSESDPALELALLSVVARGVVFQTTVDQNNRTGNLGGVAGADARCNATIPTAGSGRSFKAFLVDGTNRIASTTANAGDGQRDWVLKANKAYYGTSGALVATTGAAALFSLPPTGNLGVTSYWTGLNADWTSSANDCSDWGATGGLGTVGDFIDPQTDPATNVISNGSPQSCGSEKALICVSQ